MPGIWPADPAGWRPSGDGRAEGGPDRGVAAGGRRRPRWVASVPPHVGARKRRRPVEPEYTGPPSYPATPRWGFPNVLWRTPTAVPGTPSVRRNTQASLHLLGTATATLVAMVAVLAGGAGLLELWRYGLLVASRDSALPAMQVLTSNVTALTFAISASIVGFVTMLVAIAWLLAARAEAARRLDVVPARSTTEVVLRLTGLWIALAAVFGVEQLVTLPRDVVVVAGPVLIGGTLVAAVVLAAPVVVETEHLAVGKDVDDRPRPSRLVLVWWAAWVGNAVCAAVTLWLRMRGGIQAEADAMVLTAVTNLSAAVLAVVTALLVRQLRSLLSPDVAQRHPRQRVVAVHDAPDPPLRPAGTAGSRR